MTGSVEQAFEAVVDQDCNPWTGGGVVIGYLLHGLACATRAEAGRRSRFIQVTIEAWSYHGKAEAEEVWHEAFLGTAEEWIGDSHLLIKSETAQVHYEQAREHFEQAEVDGTITWAGEHWTLPARAAYKLVLHGEGFDEIPADILSERFQERLDVKQRLVSKLT